MWTTRLSGDIVKLLPPAYEVRWEVMFFTGVLLSYNYRGSEGITPVSGPRFLPNLWSHVLSGRYSDPALGVPKKRGTPGLDWGSLLARTRVHPWLVLGYFAYSLGLATSWAVHLLRLLAGGFCYKIKRMQLVRKSWNIFQCSGNIKMTHKI